MATVAPTQADAGDGYSGAILYQWTPLTVTNGVGKPLGPEIAQHTDLCWQVFGTFDGATLSIQGSNGDVDANYTAVTNASGGSAITFTAAGIKQQVEKPAWVRPKITVDGGGTASLTVVLFARRNPFSRR